MKLRRDVSVKAWYSVKLYGNETAKGTLTLRVGKSGYFLESPQTTCSGGEILWVGPGKPQQPNSADPDRNKEHTRIIPTRKQHRIHAFTFTRHSHIESNFTAYIKLAGKWTHQQSLS